MRSVVVAPSLKHDCPHCGAKDQSFQFRFGYDSPRREMLRPASGGGATMCTPEHIMFSCNRCFEPVSVVIGRIVSNLASSAAVALDGKYKDSHYFVVGIKPTNQQNDAPPEFTPDNVATAYGQACRALDRRDADTAGMGFRRSLDIATKALIRAAAPEGLDGVLKKNLYDRIRWLHEQNRLTEDLKDWANIIREDGNDAAHEETPYSLDEAKNLHEFAKVFLMYVFTIPGMIASQRPTEVPQDTSADGSS
jgi:hypothetical protein